MLKVNKKRKECVTSWLRLPTSLPSFSYFLYCTYTKRENVHENASPSLLKKVGKKNMKELLPMTCDNCRLILLSAVRAPPHPNSLSDYAPFCCSECTGNSFPLKYNNVPMVELINELWEAVWFWQLVGHRVGSLWWRSRVVGSDLNSFNLTCLKRHYLCFCSLCDWRTSGTARPQQVCEPWTKSKGFQDPLIKLHSCFFYIIAPIFKLYSNYKAIAAACPE